MQIRTNTRAGQAFLKALQIAHHSSSPNVMAGLNMTYFGHNRKTGDPLSLSMTRGVPSPVRECEQFFFPPVLVFKVTLHRGHSMIAAKQNNAGLGNRKGNNTSSIETCTSTVRITNNGL